MGLNAYFTYQVVGWHGTGMVPYKVALLAIFVEGWIFVFLALTGMRQWLVRMIPATIKTACGVGIACSLPRSDCPILQVSVPSRADSLLLSQLEDALPSISTTRESALATS